METINQRLVRLRKAKGLTMKQVAEAIQVPPSTYRDWEYGRSIQGSPYPQLAALFEVSLTELFTGEKPQFESILVLLESAQTNLEKARQQLTSLF